MYASRMTISRLCSRRRDLPPLLVFFFPVFLSLLSWLYIHLDCLPLLLHSGYELCRRADRCFTQRTSGHWSSTSYDFLRHSVSLVPFLLLLSLLFVFLRLRLSSLFSLLLRLRVVRYVARVSVQTCMVQHSLPYRCSSCLPLCRGFSLFIRVSTRVCLRLSATCRYRRRAFVCLELLVWRRQISFLTLLQKLGGVLARTQACGPIAVPRFTRRSNRSVGVQPVDGAVCS